MFDLETAMKRFTIKTNHYNELEYEAIDADHLAEMFARDENYVNVVCCLGLHQAFLRMGEGNWFAIHDESGKIVARGGTVVVGA